MKGLELEHKNNIVSIFTEENVAGIIITMSNESIDVEMTGIENNNFVDWYKSSLEIGESIRIKVKDINQRSGFQVIRNGNDLLKKEFDLLEKELKEKGLL
jgi:hypothetical protein